MAASQHLPRDVLQVPWLLGWAGQREALEPCAAPSLPYSRGRSSHLCRLPTWLQRVRSRQSLPLLPGAATVP